MKKFILTIIVLGTVFCFSRAQVTFRASANKIVDLNENFRLTYTVNANGSKFRSPDLKDFHVLAGPNKSSSTSFEFINGKSSHKVQNSYTYILRAKKEGQFTIAPAQITVDGDEYESNSITIDVKKTATGNNNAIPKNNDPSLSTIKKGDVFISTNVSKNTVYQGERISLALKIYQQGDLISGINNLEPPGFPGLWMEEKDIPHNITFNRELIKDKIYKSAMIWQAYAYPQRSGQIEIKPFMVSCNLREMTNKKDWFGRRIYKNIEKELHSATRKVKVLPLPANKPASFTGAVGKNFVFNVEVDRNELKSNESITLKATVTGNGNLQVVDKINFNFPASFEIFDPKVSNKGSTTKAIKEYEYLIIPREPGKYTIPPVEFSYFDVAAKRYKTLRSKELKFDIEKGEDDDIYVSTEGLSREEVEAIGSDIRFIHQEKFKLKKQDHLFFGSLSFYLFYLVSLAIFLAALIVLRKRIKQNQNLVLQKNKKANKISQKRLKAAANFMKQNNKEAFYDEVIRALWGYLSDKLNISGAELSRDTVRETLSAKNIDEGIINSFVEAINDCEFAKYAPATAENQMGLDYEKARNIIKQLVNVLS